VKKLILAAVGLSVLATGCFKVDYTTSKASTSEPTEEIWRHRVVWGIMELDGTLALDEVCPSGVAKVHTERDIITGLVTMVAANGLYAPSMINVWCVDGSAYRATMSGDAVVGLEAPIGQALPEGASFSEECAD
jgi:hypothetical protein